MKSTFTGFERSKATILTILEAMNFDFWGISRLKISKISYNLIFRAATMVKIAVFGTFIMTRIDFTKNQSGKKILKFPHFEFRICPGLLITKVQSICSKLVNSREQFIVLY